MFSSMWGRSAWAAPVSSAGSAVGIGIVTHPEGQAVSFGLQFPLPVRRHPRLSIAEAVLGVFVSIQ